MFVSKGDVYSSFAAPVVDENTAKVWALSANDIMDDDVDIIDDDDLLDEEDLKKPDPASLRGDCFFLFSKN